MPREQKQQDITTLFNQKKKITSKYFKGTLNENSVNDATGAALVFFCATM